MSYLFFTTTRYFSAHKIKLTLKYTVETQEIVMDEVAKSLDLNPNRFALMAGLCGNHVLTMEDLRGFHARLIPDMLNKDKKEVRSIFYWTGMRRLIVMIKLFRPR